MAASRDLAFPLVIVCLVLIRGCSPLPTTSQLPETNPQRRLTPRGPATETFELGTEDYDRLYDSTVTPIPRNTVSPSGKTPERCDYNLCLESQIPCAVMAKSGCFCPGLSSHHVLPDAPNLKSVSWNGSEVVARWCAPLSYVTAYIVKVRGRESQRFREDQRSGGLGDMDHNTEVCVVAVNDAGDSEGSCLTYSDSSLPLTAGLIGGALGLLLLLLLAVLLWRHKKQRKQEASISMHDTAETE